MLVDGHSYASYAEELPSNVDRNPMVIFRSTNHFEPVYKYNTESWKKALELMKKEDRSIYTLAELQELLSESDVLKPPVQCHDCKAVMDNVNMLYAHQKNKWVNRSTIIEEWCMSDDTYNYALETFNKDLNRFKIESGLSREHWIKKGWIFKEDPLGWFQWYCRYSMGRRLLNVDEIQIKRWKNFRRHVVAIQKNCEKNDLFCRKKQRQAILQWAYNPFI